MDDFSFLSESNDSAVEEIIAQAMDESILEQVAAINCSGFSDSILPTDLETRFRKLKSFPVTNQKQKTEKTYIPSSNSMKEEAPTSLNPHMKTPTSSSNEATVDSQSQEQLRSSNKGKGSPNSSSEEESVVYTSKKSKAKKGLKSKLKSKSGSSSSPSASSDEESVVYTSKKSKAKKGLKSKLKSKSGSSSSPSASSDKESVVYTSKKSKAKKRLKSKSKSKGGSSSSPSASSDSEVLSPPRQKCWFWCSPKKVSRRKGKEKRVDGRFLDTLDWGKDDGLLSDLSMFSLKDQQKKLKKALKEEEKVAREAKKVVEWAKQASARMNVSVISDVSSDEERFK